VVIRPLVYCSEEDIVRFSEAMTFPIIPCDLCGSQDNLKRQRMKALITELHADNPKVRGNMLAALGNVVPSHLLDRDLIARLSGTADGSGAQSRPEGWRGFDGALNPSVTRGPFTILTDD